jgi:hypothetical protein
MHTGCLKIVTNSESEKSCFFAHDVSFTAVQDTFKHLKNKIVGYDRRSEMVLVRDLPELAELCLDHCESADLPS